jgi:hypothetical protein
MGTRKSETQEQSSYSQKPWFKHYDFRVPEPINFPRQPVSQMINLAALPFADRLLCDCATGRDCHKY